MILHLLAWADAHQKELVALGAAIVALLRAVPADAWAKWPRLGAAFRVARKLLPDVVPVAKALLAAVKPAAKSPLDSQVATPPAPPRERVTTLPVPPEE